MKKPLIGILTWRKGTYFLEPAYFRQLIKEGRLLGADVFLFSPQDVMLKQYKVRGFIPNGNNGWNRREYKLPDVVIDRYRNLKPAPAFRQYKAFREKASFLYTNHRLGSKWDVYQVLYAKPQLRRWLPHTEAYSQSMLQEMLIRYSQLYIKPSNGTGGRGILRVSKRAAGFRLLGRDRRRQIRTARLSSVAGLLKWTESWTHNDHYLIQEGLSLELTAGSVSDIRLLIQKDGSGQWDITGMGMRTGGRQSATSNLHGGGSAFQIEQVLPRHFSRNAVSQIISECRELAFLTAAAIEQKYGRMMELGLDIGVDVHGHVWLIEVNPKPGRDIFKRMGQPDVYRTAVRRPIMYAMYLAEENGMS